MSILLDQRADGTLALYIDGDLQFDSRDEAIYHESLALPALALAERRHAGPLRALVCGGGDGLIARELLKSPRLARLDLVDYDPAMLELARTELAPLNGRSLEHFCTHVTTGDAWEYVERAKPCQYHLIVVDLTVPQDAAGARFHTIDWYERLGALLGERGVLAVNGASPSGAPLAYWSIYNALRAAGLHPRPYRVALPSFAACGYGDDWGFLLASPRPMSAAELTEDLALAEPRRALHSPAQLRRLFAFPAQLVEQRAEAQPTRLGSDLLLHYLYNGSSADLTNIDDVSWDGLARDHDDTPLPKPDDGRRLLPPALRASLAGPPGARPDEETRLWRVLDLMPALQHGQTREMIAAFLESPERFLAAIDLRGLVERLLRRAAELPRRLVAELRLLRRALAAFAGDHARLLRLGMRIVTILTLVVIIANLIYPDAIYGKGGESGSGGAATGDTISLAQPSQGLYDASAGPTIARGNGFGDSNLGRSSAIDETGSLFPVRRYRYYPSYHSHGGYGYYHSHPRPSEPAREDLGAYRLTAEADILPDGKVAISLSDRAYLLLGDEFTTLVDTTSGLPLLYLEREPAQIWRVGKELERQQLGLAQTVRGKEAWIQWMSWLEFAPWRAGDQKDLASMRDMTTRLTTARRLLGAVPSSEPPLPEPPLAGAQELFSGVWIVPTGDLLALRLPEGLTFLDGKGWYRDQARTQPFGDPYPTTFKTFIIAELDQQIRDSDATGKRLSAALSAARAELAGYQSDKAEYDAIARTSGPNEQVEYGTSEIALIEAQRRTNDDIARTEQRLALLQRQLNDLPNTLALAAKVRAALAEQ